MRPIRPTIAVALLLSSGLVFLSAQTPVSSSQAQPARVTTATPIIGPMPHPALVLYTGGQLEVRAHNSSMNQILNDVARKTGMKITGSVNEDHVFGWYGPASPATVLTTLLEGTGSNMVLRVSPAGTPAELILTPRLSSAPLACADPPCSANPTTTVQASTSGSPGPAVSTPAAATAQPAGASAVQGATILPAAVPVAPGTVDPATGQTVWPQHHVVQQPETHITPSAIGPH